AQKDVWMQPGGSVTVDMPLDDAAKFTGVAAMFLEPDRKKNTWRVVLSRDELEPDTPRLIEVSGNTLTLLPVKDK
ncbi:type VI secretion lipoprotein TssJ, partial [Escherichia coli]